MKQETRYRYERRIKELEARNTELRSYEMVCLNIFNTVTDQISENKQINMGWIMKQFRTVFK